MLLTEIENKYNNLTLEKFMEYSRGKAYIAGNTFGGDLYYSENTIKGFENLYNIPNNERLFPIEE